ncbi:MAG TPA: DNA-binding response regulator [Cytophagales bacterium]|nr:DNA-binding response regulator [Cytophagales bacterium]HAA22858.1 DNA-binding response regulator [Cytophagales bacterium]HAP59791.1 DNA-binding response regulator [Cytophagales bacterium]
MSLRCIIVDDEPLAREVIEAYCDRLDHLEIVASVTNAMEAFGALQEHAPVDVLFLDIQMPKLTGIDFLKSLHHKPKVIFTTAYRDYALEGYDLDVVDYLLKPIAFDRFLKAVGKVLPSQPATSAAINDPDLTPNSAVGEAPYMFLKADKKMVKLYLHEIGFIESLKDYVRVFTPDKVVVSHQTLTYLEEKLPKDQFLRVHKSYLVNLSQVNAYSATTLDILDQEVPIGRSHKAEVMERLQGAG